MIQIQTIPVGELEANCHIVSDGKGNAVLIDPGADASELAYTLTSLRLKPLAMLLTHSHFDHFGAAAALMQQFSLPLYVHELDEPALHSVRASGAQSCGFGDQFRDLAGDIRTFTDGETLSFSDELVFTVMHTPGHSPGGSCFLLGSDKIFTGDTLFRNAVGRIDLPGGNLQNMRESLRKLGALPGDRTVYCGHYENTTLEHERMFSPYLTKR